MSADKKLRLVMMGTGTFAEPTFEAILASRHPVVGLVTRPEKPLGEKRSTTRQVGKGIKNIAEEHGIPVLEPESVNLAEGIAWLRERQPDLLVVAAYGEILSDEVLRTATYGGINVHASLLPKYRGAAPVAWAIYHGEEETGISVIRMSVKLDAGDVLVRRVVRIDPNETAGELEARLAPLGAEAALEAIEMIAAGKTKGEKQDPSLVTRAPKLKKSMGLIDWTRPARDVRNQIRAMQPWPTAYTFLHRTGKPPQRVLILRASCPDVTTTDLRPGEVLAEHTARGKLWVAAGGGSVLQIDELQPSGKRRMTASEFLAGHKLEAGDYFGPEAD